MRASRATVVPLAAGQYLGHAGAATWMSLGGFKVLQFEPETLSAVVRARIDRLARQVKTLHDAAARMSSSASSPRTRD